MVKPACKKTGHKPDEGQLVKSHKVAFLLCSLEGLFDATGIVSVDLKVPRRLLSALFLLFDHTFIYPWQPLSCDYPLVNNCIHTGDKPYET